MRSATPLLYAVLCCCALAAGLLGSAHAQDAPLAAPTRIYLPLLRGTPGLQTAEQQAMATGVLTLINEHRARAGCPPLSANESLTAAAQNHSAAMATSNFFSHRDSAGTTVGDRASRTGYSWQKVGENIAAGQSTAEAVVAAWMSSPTHRENILDCSYVHTGIGYFHQPDDAPLPGLSWPLYHYWTQVFGSPR